MLTILGRGSQGWFLRRPVAARVLANRRRRDGRPGAQSDPGDGSPGRRRQLAQVDHQCLSARRSSTHRHVGSQAQRAAGDSRRVQSDSYERARHRDLRTVSQDRRHDGQVRHHPVAVRFLGRSRCLSMHDRPQAIRGDAWRRLALGRRLGLTSGRRGRSLDPAESRFDVPDGQPSLGRTLTAAGSWGRCTTRSICWETRPAKNQTTWCCTASRSNTSATAIACAAPWICSAVKPTWPIAWPVPTPTRARHSTS